MKKLFALAALLTLAAPLSAQAAVMSQDLVLSPYTTSSTTSVSSATTPGVATLQPIMVSPGNTTELKVLNPTPGPLTFAAPSLGISVVVPANAEQRVFIDASQTANLTPGQQVAYTVTDQNGNNIATSYIQNQDVAYNYQQSTTTSTTQQTESSQTVSQPSPAPVENVQPTVEQPAVEKSTTVRGFW